ncbi:MAG: response regulator [Blautia sp.]|nr:response regulator [Blautia sp.]
MQIIVVDDEEIILEGIVNTIRSVVKDGEIESFRQPSGALEYAQDHKVDIAFLDIEMPEYTGVELAKRLKSVNPQMNIIFTTSYSQYTGEAMKMHASGYILKPVTKEDVLYELDNLRRPVPEYRQDTLNVHTFGNFEVFCGKEPVRFQYSKTKELFAWLVDRQGALCSNKELEGILWEDADSTKTSYLKRLKRDLIETLEECGQKGVLSTQWGKIGVLKDKISCDYYDWIEGKPYALNAYHGEYMTQYSWGEITNGWLCAYKSDRGKTEV